ncbi:MAG: choice-of-anchor H family protein [Gammaproteobacteria bacterium]|jgi:hypothetical protein|nr:choice-of-anchor H family protein [Gammaproteobacteria bacterium]
MKTITIALLSALLLGAGSIANAADELQTSRSAGKLRIDQATDLSAVLKQREAVSRVAAKEPENYAAGTAAQLFDGVANRYDQLFEIYEADVQLLSDLDGDGFHHAINVFFDVDVSVDSARVYAKLYLSREGAPWSQYFTTDLFTIHGDDFSDAYEVETELMEGYAPGYYAVLVEIYSLDHAYMVASAVLDHHSLGKDVMIEDLSRDEPYIDSSSEYYEEYYYSSGAGSVATLLLFFLIIQFVIAARGSLALSPLFPRNDGDYKKNYKTP